MKPFSIHIKYSTAFRIALCASLLSAFTLSAEEIALHETVQLPMHHSIGWVRNNSPGNADAGWNGVLDETTWGTPSPQQVVTRVWSWKPTDAQWRALIQQKEVPPTEEVQFDLWIPSGVKHVRGIVAISGHGSGDPLFKRADLRAVAADLGLALFKFVGNPVQRGFWPRSLLLDRLAAFGEKCAHPELRHAPLFLYGHSNGTGFSALFAAAEKERVWAWVSMRPGVTFQVAQPDAATVPGLVIFGEDDHFLARPSREENLAVIPHLRRSHHVLWSFAVEPKTGHGPGEKTWPLVLSFLRHSFAARVPVDSALSAGPILLKTPNEMDGYIGQPWSSEQGGYQTLEVSPLRTASQEKRNNSPWLLNAEFAKDWQNFQATGSISQ
jgi:hypothetical protein